MIGNFFLLIERIDGKDQIVGEGLVSDVVSPGYYRCDFIGPGPSYSRVLSVPAMQRLLLFGSTAELKRFKKECFKESPSENLPDQNA